eukprot:scpid42618/ scgid13070/ Protein NLRC3
MASHEEVEEGGPPAKRSLVDVAACLQSVKNILCSILEGRNAQEKYPRPIGQRLVAFDKVSPNLAHLDSAKPAAMFAKQSYFSFSGDQELQEEVFMRSCLAASSEEQRMVKMAELLSCRLQENGAVCADADVKTCLLLGSAGCGKSTTADVLLHQWSTGKILAEKLELILSLQLCDPNVCRATCLNDLLTAALGSKAEEGVVQSLSTYFQRKPSGLCLVFDDLDVCVVQSCDEYVRNILFSPMACGHHVLVFSRPCDNAVRLSSSGEYQQHVHLLGLTAEGVYEHLEEAAGRDACISIKKEPEANISILALMSIPFFASVLCSMMEEENRLPACITRVMYWIVRNAASARLHYRVKSFRDLPPYLIQAVCELSRFAFLMVVKKKRVFSDSDLLGCNLSSQARDFGLLHRTYCSMADSYYHYQFSHIALQEYLASWFAAECTTRNLLHRGNLLANLGPRPGHLTLFWRFLSAILPREQAYPLLGDLLHRAQHSVQTPLHTSALRCAHKLFSASGVFCNEKNFKDLHRQLLQVLSLKEMQRLADVLMVGHDGEFRGHESVLDALPEGHAAPSAELYLETLLMVWKHQEMLPNALLLLESLKKVHSNLPNICHHILRLEGLERTHPDVAAFQAHPAFTIHTDSTLNVFMSYREHVLYLDTGTGHSFPAVQSILEGGLEIAPCDGNLLSIPHCSALGFVLKAHSDRVRQLGISNCLNDVRLLVLAGALSRCQVITKLDFSFNKVKNFHMIARLLNVVSRHIRTLRLDGLDIRDASFKVLSAVLCFCKRLSYLSIAQIGLTAASLPDLGRVLSQCPELQHLNVQANTSQCPELQHLNVQANTSQCPELQ